MRRLAGAAGLALIGLLLMTTATFAGGWATITPDEGSPPQPNAGEEVSLGFNILQHGETPISWVKATLVATNLTTGGELRVVATPDEPEGHYTAKVTFPESGYWTWSVEITDLIGESTPGVVAVNTADGTAPTLDTTALLAAVERARAGTRTLVDEAIGPTVEMFDSRLNQMNVELAVVKGQVASLSQQRDQLQARITELESEAGSGVEGMPILAVATVAGLAGAISGFGIVLLGRRNEPRDLTAPEGASYVATRPTTR